MHTMKQYIAAFLALAAVAVQVYAADGPIADIKAEKLTLFGALADISGATGPLSSEKARVTILAPTDEAIQTFLTDMGITVDDVKANEALADHILAYHIVLGVAASKEALFAKGNEVSVPTAAYPYQVTFKKAADGGVDVVDFQGNTATVTKANIGHGNHVIHVIDKVLYSGAYWNNIGDLVKRLPSQFSTLNAAVEKAGLVSTLSATSFADTLFLPTDKAFTASGVTLDAPAEKVAEILKYHVVAGDHTIPSGFKNGAKVKTLEGQDITVSYETGKQVNPKLVAATAYVTDASGNKIKIIHPNVFIGKAEAHVIDGVLMPKAATSATVTASPAGAITAAPAAGAITAAPAAGAAAATASKPAAAAAAADTTSSGKGATISIKKPFLPFSIDITFGRKMLQVGASSSFTPSIDLDSSEQAILNAVNSDASLSATAGAADANVANSEVATQFGVDATYADGIGGMANMASAGGAGN